MQHPNPAHPLGWIANPADELDAETLAAMAEILHTIGECERLMAEYAAMQRR